VYPQSQEPNRPRRDIVERTFNFGVAVIRFCELLGGRAGARRMVAGQLLRAGTSIGANVEEAQGAQGRKDFIAKMMISLKEAREARYWLRITFASKLHTEAPVPDLIQETTELCNILAAIVVSARKNA
jgi:four helix bundle protein